MIGIVNWLRAPRENIRLSFLFLFFWLVLGMLDQTVFNTTEADAQKVVASADFNTFDLTIAEVNDFTPARLIKKLQEVEVLINCLSFNLFVAENLFIAEWMAFLKANNKRFLVLFRPCVWELSYFSKFKTLPESHSPLLNLITKLSN